MLSNKNRQHLRVNKCFYTALLYNNYCFQLQSSGPSCPAQLIPPKAVSAKHAQLLSWGSQIRLSG